jgi:hypothetical protein
VPGSTAVIERQRPATLLTGDPGLLIEDAAWGWEDLRTRTER